MAFKDTDKILVNRDGVDYQADIGPLTNDHYLPWDYWDNSSHRVGELHVVNVETATTYSVEWADQKKQRIIDSWDRHIQALQSKISEASDEDTIAVLNERLAHALKKRDAVSTKKAGQRWEQYEAQCWRRKEADDDVETNPWEYLGWREAQGTLEPGYEFVFKLWDTESCRYFFQSVTTDFALGIYTDTRMMEDMTNMFSYSEFTGTRQSAENPDYYMDGGLGFLDFTSAKDVYEFFRESKIEKAGALFFPVARWIDGFFSYTKLPKWDKDWSFYAPTCFYWAERIFSDCTEMVEADLAGFRVGSETAVGVHLDSLFRDCTKLVTVNNFQNVASNANSLTYCFSYCSALTTVNAGTNNSVPINFPLIGNGEGSKDIKYMIRSTPNFTDSQISKWYFPNFEYTGTDTNYPSKYVANYGVDAWHKVKQSRDITNAKTAIVGQVLTANGNGTFTFNDAGGGGDVDLTDYYTKTESDSKFMPKDLRTLPALT